MRINISRSTFTSLNFIYISMIQPGTHRSPLRHQTVAHGTTSLTSLPFCYSLFLSSSNMQHVIVRNRQNHRLHNFMYRIRELSGKQPVALQVLLIKIIHHLTACYSQLPWQVNGSVIPIIKPNRNFFYLFTFTYSCRYNYPLSLLTITLVTR